MIILIWNLFKLLVIGIIPNRFKKEEIVKPVHSHRYAKWTFYNKIVHKDIEHVGGEPILAPKRVEIIICRMCLDCLSRDYKSFFTADCSDENELEKLTNDLKQYLEETVMYVEPKKVPPPPPPKCQHKWTKRGIVSRWKDDNQGVIDIERYCLECGDKEIKRYRTDEYPDGDHSQVADDLTRLEDNIKDTLLKEESSKNVSVEEIRLALNEFAGGAEFIEVTQCSLLADRIYQLYSAGENE